MSLAVLVRVAVPALFALGISAAYLIFRKRQPEEGHHGGGDRSSRPQFTSPDGTDIHRPTEGTQPRRRSSRLEPEALPNAELEECSICTEERVLVELYPCSHRSMCESCVIKIISRNSRACPFCRRRIHGYRDA